MKLRRRGLAIPCSIVLVAALGCSRGEAPTTGAESKQILKAQSGLSHRITRTTPSFKTMPRGEAAPSGELAEGTAVKVLEQHEGYWKVQSVDGSPVFVAADALEVDVPTDPKSPESN